MEDYSKLNTINQSKQKELDEIKSICQSLDKTEDLIIEKIILRYQELEKLKKEYINMTETYNNIVNSLVH